MVLDIIDESSHTSSVRSLPTGCTSEEIIADLDKVHRLVHSGLHQLLDVPLLLVGEFMWVAARAARTSTVRGCQLVVVLPGAVCH